VWIGGSKGAQESGRAFAIPKQTSSEHGDGDVMRPEKGKGNDEERKGSFSELQEARVIARGWCFASHAMLMMGWYKRRRGKQKQSGADRG
jgi:hypothetical protein